MFRPKPLSRCTVFAVFLFALSSGARANLIPALDSVVLSGGSYLYTYHVDLTANSMVGGNSCSCFVTLFDIHGYVPGSATVLSSASGNPSDWVVSEPMVGPPAFMQAPPDSPAYANVSFEYCSHMALHGPMNLVGNFQPLFVFSMRSKNNVSSKVVGIYDAQSEAINPAFTIQGNAGMYRGPLSSPEPGALAWLIGACVAASAMAYRRRRPLR